MTGITTAQLHALAPACDAALVAPGLDASARRFAIDTPLRLAHWLAQLHEESGGFTTLVEDLDYATAARIHAVFPAHFAGVAQAAAYVHQPEALANRVYGYRGGNTLPGSGWKWRGRGWIQLTFYDAYVEAARALDRPYVASPDLVATPPDAALTAGWYWSRAGCNAAADADDLALVTLRVNGSATGNLAARQTQLARAKAIFR